MDLQGSGDFSSGTERVPPTPMRTPNVVDIMALSGTDRGRVAGGLGFAGVAAGHQLVRDAEAGPDSGTRGRAKGRGRR